MKTGIATRYRAWFRYSRLHLLQADRCCDAGTAFALHTPRPDVYELSPHHHLTFDTESSSMTTLAKWSCEVCGLLVRLCASITTLSRGAGQKQISTRTSHVLALGSLPMAQDLKFEPTTDLLCRCGNALMLSRTILRLNRSLPIRKVRPRATPAHQLSPVLQRHRAPVGF
jgi:hypothetical protein